MSCGRERQAVAPGRRATGPCDAGRRCRPGDVGSVAVGDSGFNTEIAEKGTWRFARSMPGNVFRIFEKGGEEPLSIGIPTVDEPPGKPERRLSERGYGTLNKSEGIVQQNLVVANVDADWWHIGLSSEQR